MSMAFLWGERAVTRLTARVPPGPIEVSAEIPLTLASFAEVNLAPGKSGSVEIRLSDGKEVDEHTTLLLVEAVDDIVPLSAPSLTLRFMQGSRFAPVARIEPIDAENLQGDLRANLAEHFRVDNGEIVRDEPRPDVRGAPASVRRDHRADRTREGVLG